MKVYGNLTLRVCTMISLLLLATYIQACNTFSLDSGRTMVCQYYFVQSSDVQETLKVYDEIRTLNTVRSGCYNRIIGFNFCAMNQDTSQSGTVRAIIGSTTEEDTISLSTVSKRHEMPIMGYVAESGKLSDKVCLTLLNEKCQV